MIWGNETLAADVLVVSRRDTFHEHTGVAHHAVEQPVRAHPSLVEHSLGKGEVVSSILTGSTIFVCETSNLERAN
jgi:hypothetical protein